MRAAMRHNACPSRDTPRVPSRRICFDRFAPRPLASDAGLSTPPLDCTMSERVLTGITTSGTPHLGNYVGAIRPAIVASQHADVQSYFFLADYHALIKCQDPQRVARSRLEIAATWLACGLDTQRVTFYCQSDVPETAELNWLLNCVTPKGAMNRAHAYKAAVDANAAEGRELDDGVSMGLYCYPILMAADILLFNAHRVPVGRDQIQHIEMARDLAQRFNHLYAPHHPLFVLPQAEVDDDVATLPGLDGRKMSKSYDNTVPLFEGGAAALRAALARVVTDSRAPGEPKDPHGSHLVTLHDAFASSEQREQLHEDLRQGLAWGEAKTRVFECIDAVLAPMRERYDALMAQPQHIEAVLQAGAAKARAVATPLMAAVREAVGLRGLGQASVVASAQVAPSASLPVIKQYRQDDGLFYFKLVSASGQTLLQSQGLSQGREAGQWVARLRQEGPAALAELPLSWQIDGRGQDLQDALQSLLEASQAQAAAKAGAKPGTGA